MQELKIKTAEALKNAGVIGQEEYNKLKERERLTFDFRVFVRLMQLIGEYETIIVNNADWFNAPWICWLSAFSLITGIMVELSQD